LRIRFPSPRASTTALSVSITLTHPTNFSLRKTIPQLFAFFQHKIPPRTIHGVASLRENLPSIQKKSHATAQRRNDREYLRDTISQILASFGKNFRLSSFLVRGPSRLRAFVFNVVVWVAAMPRQGPSRASPLRVYVVRRPAASRGANPLWLGFYAV
jgi:hypothetical protein